MKKIYYEKVGRKYKPVKEYDSDLMSSFPEGNHLVSCQPGCRSIRYKIDPAYAPMIAAGRVALDSITEKIVKKSELRPQKVLLTDSQKEAWNHLAKELGDGLATLEASSIQECVETGIQAMQDEAEKLLAYPSVRKAYEHFMLMCKLVTSQENSE